MPVGYGLLDARTDAGCFGLKSEIAALEGRVRDVGDLRVWQGGRVRGRVVTEAGLPIEGAEVEVGWRFNRHRSGADGRFDAGFVLPGRRTIRVEKPGFILANTLKPEVVEGEDLVLELVLETAAPIAGQVVDESGSGIADAYVLLSRTDEAGLLMGREHWNVETEDDGSFSFQCSPQGTYSLSATKAGFRDDHRSRISAGPPPVQITLRRGCLIKGYAVDASTGAPVALAQARLLSPPSDPQSKSGADWRPAWGAIALETEADGAFAVRFARQGTFVLEGVAEGYLAARSDPVEVEFDRMIDGLVLRLQAGRGLQVQVRDRVLDVPLPDAIVEVFEGRARGRRSIARAAGDSAGMARFPPLMPGEYYAEARHGGFAPGGAATEIRAGAAPELVLLDLGPGGEISGQVTNARGEPEPGVHAVASSPDGGSFETDSGSDGSYSIQHLPPARYAVEAVDQQMNWSAFRAGGDSARPKSERFPHLLEEGRQVVVNLAFERKETGSLTGTVTFDGQPAIGIEVAANHVDAKDGVTEASFSLHRLARTDDHGVFSIRRVPAGNYHLTVHRGRQEGYHGVDVIMGSGEDLRVTIDIRLGRMKGVVLDDGTSEPVTRFKVTAVPQSRIPVLSFGFERQGWTSFSGKFEIPNLQRGLYDVTFEAEGYESLTEHGVNVSGDQEQDAELAIRLVRRG